MESQKAATRGAADSTMLDPKCSAGFVPIEEKNFEIQPKRLDERPALATWNFECAMAHRQENGQVEFLTKPRPVWLTQGEVPGEAEVEYWHRYQLFHNTPTLENRPTKLDKNDETNSPSDHSRKTGPPEHDRASGFVPVYGSLAEVMKRTLSPV